MAELCKFSESLKRNSFPASTAKKTFKNYINKNNSDPKILKGEKVPDTNIKILFIA